MIAAGAYWANRTWGSYWSWDPKETWAAITWLVYAGYLHMRITRGWRGRRAAYFAILGFAVVMFTFFGVTYLLPGITRLCLAICNPHRGPEPPKAAAQIPADTPAEDFRLSAVVRVNWQLKAFLPVGFVLLAGLLLFTLATVSLRDPERHAVLIVAGGGAVVICAVSMFVLAYLIQRPMVELQEKMELVGNGNLDVLVSFSHRNDEIGDLGRNFNQMVQQLRDSRQEIERLHRTQMSRAEHLATLGELATGLAHEIRNPLAGIAGVIEIVGRDLPTSSPARAVVKDVRLEIGRISRTLTDLLETARPRHPEVRRSNLNTTVEHAVMLARQQILSRPITIELQKDADLPEVEHDSDQIHQVLLNLLLNAVQAIEKTGTVRVEISSRKCAPSHRRRRRQRHLREESAQHLPSLLHHQRRRHRPGPIPRQPHRRRS